MHVSSDVVVKCHYFKFYWLILEIVLQDSKQFFFFFNYPLTTNFVVLVIVDKISKLFKEIQCILNNLDRNMVLIMRCSIVADIEMIVEIVTKLDFSLAHL